MFSFSLGFLLIYVLPIAIQVALVVHAARTGRNLMWIWILVFVPVVGSLAYFFVEILPELMSGHTAQHASRRLKIFRKALDPGADLRRYENAARLTTNVASRQDYADELVRLGRFDEAITQYRGALTGLYQHDAKLMLGLARAQFGKGDATGARTTLDELYLQNPDFTSPDCQLLYARALEGEGDVQKALSRYAALAGTYPGAEAAVRYAQLLSAQGRREEAQRVARELLDQARIAPAHYRKAQSRWLDSAQRLAT